MGVETDFQAASVRMEVFFCVPYTLNKAFGCRVATKEDKPTNGEFIAMIADKLALEQRTA